MDNLIVSSEQISNDFMDSLSGYFYWVPVYAIVGMFAFAFSTFTTINIVKGIMGESTIDTLS